jgi:hypothetical protein
MIVKRIGVWSAARIYAAITTAFGLLAGIMFALIALAGAGLSQDAEAWLGPVFGVGAIVFFPMLYGIMGLVMGALGAAIYNLFAGVVGGLSIDVE